MADSTSRALLHWILAAEELALGVAAGLQELGVHTTLLAALRTEERRWRARADADPAAARVAELIGALADVFEPAPRTRDTSEHSARRDTRRKFDPPRVRWDTRTRWRS